MSPAHSRTDHPVTPTGCIRIDFARVSRTISASLRDFSKDLLCSPDLLYRLFAETVWWHRQRSLRLIIAVRRLSTFKDAGPYLALQCRAAGHAVLSEIQVQVITRCD
jgi:hypothetical protein